MKNLLNFSVKIIFSTLFIFIICNFYLFAQNQIQQGVWNGEQIEYVAGQIAIKVSSIAQAQNARTLIQSKGGIILQDFDRLN